MATRRHIRAAFFCLLAVLLISPPLTSAVADGLGIELTHHHCESDGHGTGGHLADESGPGATHDGAAQSDPYQCDQCHAVLAALTTQASLSVFNGRPVPTPNRVPVLLAVRVSPAFRPPIS